MKVVWFSTGVSSFISAYLVKESVDKIVYCHIEDQHSDSLRFLRDCENKLGIPIEIIQSPYKNVENVCKAFNMVNFRGLAKCTGILKMRIRKEWEYQHKGEKITYVWGFDRNEKLRALELIRAMPNFYHEFPLIERNLSKEDAHGISRGLSIRRPLMYDLGYQNNNCIGCLKGGIGYWNKIRKDFPHIFKQRAELERLLGYSILSEEIKLNGKRKKTPLFLDELDPTRGRIEDEIMESCGIACELNL